MVGAVEVDQASVSDEVVARIPPIVDLDAHVVEPPDVWSSRLPARYREAGPHIELLPAGVPKLVGSGYVEEPGNRRSRGGLVVLRGPPGLAQAHDRRGRAFPGTRFSCEASATTRCVPGVGGVRERLEDMDLNGVQAQLCFPNYPRFCGQQFLWGKDRELARLCVEAYNDWMVEEWCGEAGGRLIPLCLVPLWDADLAAAEVTRNAERGVRAVAFTELPTYLDLPSLYTGYWDPFFAACQETGDGGLHAHRFGHEDATGVARRTRCGRRHDPLRQQRGEPRRRPLLGDACTDSRSCA